MVTILCALISIFAFRFRSRASLELRLLALQHQLAVLRRQRIFKAAASPVGSPWMWTLAFGHHEDRAATPPRRRAAWLRIFVVRCGLPCDPPVGGHSCNGGMIPRFHRLFWLVDMTGRSMMRV